MKLIIILLLLPTISFSQIIKGDTLIISNIRIKYIKVDAEVYEILRSVEIKKSTPINTSFPSSGIITIDSTIRRWPFYYYQKAANQ